MKPVSEDGTTETWPDEARAEVAPSALRIIGDGISLRHPLERTGTLVIGRAAGADVQVEHPSISRRHARLHLGERIRIEDLGSANGTKVRGVRLKPGASIELTTGEPVDLGAVLLVLEGAWVNRRAPVPADPVSSTLAPPEGRGVIIESPSMKRLHALVDRVAPAPISVLILGETGAGKEILARAVHDRSARSGGPLVVINCAAIPENLLESELFGYVRGAFSGADRDKRGQLEAASGGTVVLDELGELPASLQAKLLRVIESREVQPIGALEPRPLDVRWVASTNRDLEEEVRAGRFRADLYFRLAGITLLIPPLRERREEIEPLARSVLRRAARAMGKRAPRLTPGSVDILTAYDWPGNIRELANLMERLVLLLAPGADIRPEHLAELVPPAPPEPPQLPAQTLTMRDGIEALEEARIREALQRAAGNQSKAAQLLGIARSTLLERLDKYGIQRPRKR